jgi:DNA repair protein RadC
LNNKKHPITAPLWEMVSSIIIAYSYPSNNLRTSDEGRDLTKKIRDAGKLLDMNLHDRLILRTEGEFVSYTIFEFN